MKKLGNVIHSQEKRQSTEINSEMITYISNEQTRF